MAAAAKLHQYNSGPVAMHEPYKSDDISSKNTFGINNGAAK